MTKSEQARADAMADAETLWSVGLRVVGTEAGWQLQLPAQWGILTRQAMEAGLLATAILRAEDAARAAFGAVPGLRGDR